MLTPLPQMSQHPVVSCSHPCLTCLSTLLSHAHCSHPCLKCLSTLLFHANTPSTLLRTLLSHANTPVTRLCTLLSHAITPLLLVTAPCCHLLLHPASHVSAPNCLMLTPLPHVSAPCVVTYQTFSIDIETLVRWILPPFSFLWILQIHRAVAIDHPRLFRLWRIPNSAFTANKTQS